VNDDPPFCLKFLPFRSYLPLLNLPKLLSTEQLLHVLKHYYLPFVSLCLYYQHVRRVVRILYEMKVRKYLPTYLPTYLTADF
jgi:hypothetical protein